jgi:hypothetical protein
MILSASLQILGQVQSGKLLNLLDDEEFTPASVSRYYCDAFPVAIAHGDIFRQAFLLCKTSTKTILACKDSRMVQRMGSLVRNPPPVTRHTAVQGNEER